MPLPVPQITDDNGAFWTGGRNGELLITRCTSCGYWIHHCPAARSA